MFGQSRVIRHGRTYRESYKAEVNCRLAYFFDTAIDTLISSVPLAAIFQRLFCPHAIIYSISGLLSGSNLSQLICVNVHG